MRYVTFRGSKSAFKSDLTPSSQSVPGIDFESIGVPRDLASAERLAANDPHQFQQWVSWQVGGYPRD